ncbi:MAG: c-type cytochrome domain-containing protein [Acidiferrobacterales bacterium]
MAPKKTITAVALILVILGAGCTKPVSFKEDVNPILQANCASCHSVGGKGYTASGFSVESYEQVMKGTKFGAVIVPGASITSTLVILMEHKADHSINMPRSTKQVAANDPFLLKWKEPVPLPLEQIEIVKTWIDQGAEDN